MSYITVYGDENSIQPYFHNDEFKYADSVLIISSTLIGFSGIGFTYGSFYVRNNKNFTDGKDVPLLFPTIISSFSVVLTSMIEIILFNIILSVLGSPVFDIVIVDQFMFIFVIAILNGITLYFSWFYANIFIPEKIRRQLEKYEEELKKSKDTSDVKYGVYYKK